MMDSNFRNSFTFNFKEILIDEIALEGLEGIGLRLLWNRVEYKISSPVTDKMIIRFWKFIVIFNNVAFYQNPEPMPTIEILDRFSMVHEETGQLLDPVAIEQEITTICYNSEVTATHRYPILQMHTFKRGRRRHMKRVDYLDGPYNYAPVSNNGSSVYYNQRVLIDKLELQQLSYDDVIAKYGDHLTIVASTEERWKALAGHVPISYLSQLSTAHYCILEIVGKSRDNGQMTVGNTNLTKIMRDPKHLFYIRKHLQQMGLVKTQCHTQFVQGRGMKSILLRLKRFHKPILLSTPKVGKLHNIIEYLKTKHDHSEKVDLLIKTGYLNHKHSKRLQKTINVFRFDDRQLKVDEISKSRRQKLFVKKKYISLDMFSDDTDNSDDETSTAPLKCQYKVGVSLLRQAYERFLDAGLKGLTQIQLAQILGVEFYTSRTICRTLKSKNIVKEFLEDKGRQRTARYIAVAATSEIDNQYAEEKKKFLDFMNTSNVEQVKDEIEVPLKKMKVEESDSLDIEEVSEDVDTDITEVKVIEGLENMSNESLLNSKKNPTLRQLKFANGLLKVVRDKRAISGYQTLSTLVSKEIGEPPMDTKALKSFVQKLVKDGQVKMYKIKWPGFHQKYTTLVCDPLMKSNDPVIICKYKDISLKALTSKKTKIKRALTEGVSRPLSQFAYPRYMKIQKLHELVINVVYFSETNSEFPEGFASVLSVVPHMTVGFAVGNISNVAISDIAHTKISDNLLDIKLKDAPSDLYERLLQSKSLQNSIRSNLKALAMMGLIQLISETVPLPSADYEGNLLSYLFYVNRRAKVLDTTGVWPKPNTDIGTLEKSYYFKTFEDVTTYWNDVYNISTSTNVEIVIKRDRKKIKPPVRKSVDVELYDNGERYGDGLGPCAFDSSFFMDIPRLWRTFYVRAAKVTQPQIRKKKKVKKIKLEAIKKPKNRPVIKKKPPKVITELASNRRKRRQPDSLIKWSQWEDKIIMLCKAAITIMSPTSHPDCLRVRNAVAKEILYMDDDKKTATACHRRAAALESNSILMHEKECILNEVRRRPDLIQKYEGLLKRLRIRYSANLSRLFKECKIPMMELVRAMCLISRSKSFTQRVPCIAVDLEDFNKKFNITTSSTTAPKTFNMYRTPVDSDRVLASLKEGIIMTTMLSYENTINSDVASKVYAIFKKHPEVVLRTALEQLRKSGAISARDKILNNHMHRVEIEDIVQSSYKISAFYQRRWICRLNSEFIEHLGDSLETEVPVDGIKGSPEMNCIFCELLACDIFDLISITTPAISGYSGTIMQEEQLNVIDIENKYSLKSGLAGCKLKCDVNKFSDLYEDINIEDCMKEIQSFNVVDHTDIVELSDDEIVDHLEKLGKKGSTFKDLKAHFSYDTKELCKKLNDLEMKKIITRVGYYENKIILTEYFKYWSLTVEAEISFVPVPWLSLDYEVRFDILFKWAGVIVNKIFESSGCSISVLSDNCEVLSYRAVQDICMFLQKCECVTLNCIEIPEPDLFSDNLPPNELMDFNRWDLPENIVVFPTKNLLTKYAYVRKKILEKWL